MKIRIAAVQPALVPGDVRGNLERVEDLVRDASSAHAPDLIVLPEAFSSPNVHARSIRAVPRPLDGEPFSMLRELSRELGCVIAGGALSVRGGDAYGTYMLVEPDGRAHFHDKDLPSGTECYYYRGGDDQGLTTVAAWGRPRVGLVSGLEWGRSRTAQRLRDAQVEVVIGGQCWPWTAVDWEGPIGRWMLKEHRRSVDLCAQVPSTMARIVGAPAVMASHVGPVRMQTPMAPWRDWNTEMAGQTTICDGDGTVLAQLGMEEGEGHIAAVVTLGSVTPSEPVPTGYFTYEMGGPMTATFHLSNALGGIAYRARRLRRGFPWQDAPGMDLADEVGPRAVRSAALRRREPTVDAVVTQRRQLAEGVVGLTLEAKDGRPLEPWRPGSHVDVVLADGLVRQYSLCGDQASGAYEIGVLREEGGRGGSVAVTDLAMGDSLQLRGPRNHFPLAVRADAHHAFVAGGIGITPIVAMVREACSRDVDWSLLYTGRAANSMAFRDEISALDGARVELRSDDVDGVPDIDAWVAGLGPATVVHACGPAPLLDALERACAAHEIPLYVERFTATVDAAMANTEFDIIASRSGKTVHVDAHVSALDALREAGIEVESSCSNGLCGSCQVQVLSGEPDQRDSITTRPGMRRADVMMPCVSRSCTPALTLDV